MGTCRAAAAAGVLYRRCICSFGWVWKCLTSLLLNPNASASCPAGTPGGVAIKGVIGRVCAGRQGKPGWQSEILEIRGVHWGRNGSVLRAGTRGTDPIWQTAGIAIRVFRLWLQPEQRRNLGVRRFHCSIRRSEQYRRHR